MILNIDIYGWRNVTKARGKEGSEMLRLLRMTVGLLLWVTCLSGFVPVSIAQVGQAEIDG